MNQSDSTFELVKSLTKNEKRYFRVFTASSGHDKNYLQVFDALDKMKTYDARSLNKKLVGSKLNVSYEKNYLHKQLLKTLRTFYSENNSTITLQDILKNLEILYKKRLNAQCQQLLTKGMIIAEKYEQWHYQLELIDWQYRVYGRTGNYKKLAVYESEGLSEKKKLCDAVSVYAQVQKIIYDVLIIVQNQSIYAEKKIKEEFKTAIRKSLGLLNNYENNFRISELIYGVLYLSSHYSGDFKGAYKYALANYKLYHRFAHFKNDLPFKFFVAIGNLVTRCINLEKFEEGFGYISELKLFVKQLPPFASQDIQQEQHSAVFGYESRILIAVSRYADALKATKEFERSYNPENLRRNIILMDQLHIARVYFVNGLQKQSLQRVNVLLNEKPGGIKLDFFVHAMLMRLCIQYDLNNYDVLGHLAQTTRRFLQKHNLDDAFAYDFIEIIKQAGKTDDQKKHRQLFAKHYPASKNKVEKTMTHYYDLTGWMAGKLK
jgi:hypothetical protein